MKRPCFAPLLAAALAAWVAVAVAAAPRPAAAAPPAPPGAGEALVRLDARFVEAATGLEAEWGATGQILLQPDAGDAALAHWRGARALATSPSRQSVTLAAGARATIRVGREIPFAGWFFQLARRGGAVEEGADWREVESTLEVEVQAPGREGGGVRLLLTPELGFLKGRTRRSVAFPDLRGELVLAEGAEARFAPQPGQEEFYRRFLAGYDPLRRVRPVDLLLRVAPAPAEPVPPAETVPPAGPEPPAEPAPRGVPGGVPGGDPW